MQVIELDLESRRRKVQNFKRLNLLLFSPVNPFEKHKTITGYLCMMHVRVYMTAWCMVTQQTNTPA